MSVCQEIQLLGVSTQSWERAAAAAVREAVDSFADRCVIRRLNTDGHATPTFTTEIIKLDMTLKSTGEIDRYRALVKVSFLAVVPSSSLGAVKPSPDPERR